MLFVGTAARQCERQYRVNDEVRSMDFVYSRLKIDMKDIRDEASLDFEAEVILKDMADKQVATVRANFSPKVHCGGFRLPESANVDQVLSRVASLQTSDGRRFRVSKLRRCGAVHLVSPDKPHLEFDYEPLA